MKKLFIVLLVILVAPFSVLAYAGSPLKAADGKKIELKTKTSSCPEYPTMVDEYTCMECHIRGKSFALREKDPQDKYDYPSWNVKIVAPGFGYYLMDNINAKPFVAALDYMINKHNVKHVAIEINNPGGSLFAAWRMIGYMANYEKQGIVFETRVYGYGMSAGFMMLLAGTPGHRYAGSGATLMWHELLTFKFLSIETPSSTEDEARIMRELQNTVNTWMSKRSNMTKEEIDKKVHRQEWWMSGLEAKKKGFVDHVIGATEKKVELEQTH